MAYTRGRCSNFDYCSIADSRRDIEVRVGDDFVCPECGKPLKAPPVSSSGSRSIILPAIIGAGVLVLVGGAIFLGMRMGSSGRPAMPAPAAQVTAPAPAAPAPPVQQQAATQAVAPAPAPPAPTESVLARLAGAKEIGASLAPKLAAAYLTQIGDTDIKTEQGAGGATRIVGTRGDRQEAIIVDNSNTDDGFKALASHGADVVMAARRILPAERDQLASLGDMTSASAEHVLGIAALSVVVNAANPLVSLTRDQIKGIFTGAITNWSALGLTAGPIDVIGLSAGPQATAFSNLALSGGALPASARHVDTAAQAAQAVAADPRAIGVTDIASIGATRPVPIADTGAIPVAVTNQAAVASEDYPLAYRLYLYTAPGAAGGIGERFAEYALSPAGQGLVQQAGLVSQTLKPEAAPPPATTTDKFKAYVAGAKHLAIAFHFNPNSTDLDQKGTRDLDRVMNYILSNHYTPDHLILIGFADNQGDAAQNIAVSKKRADAVAALFTARGLPPGKVAGFGAELPIADNGTEEGREKNRRVEVFIAP